MAIPAQLITVSLRQGLDTKSDPKQVIPGRLLVLENGVLTELGAVQKRNGYAPLASGIIGSASSVAAARLLSTFKSQLLLGTGAEAYGFGTLGWADKGICEALKVTSAPVIRNTYQQTSADATVHPGGVTVAAWEDSSSGARYCVIDTATGQQIIASTLLSANAQRPKCVSVGAYALIFYFDSSLVRIRYVAVPAAAPTAPLAAADLATDVAVSGVYDVAVGGSNAYVAYANNTAGATQLSAKFVTALLGGSAELTFTGSTALPTAVSIFVDATQRPWIAWSTATPAVLIGASDVNLAGVSFGPTTVAAVQARNLAGAVSGSTATLLYDVAGAQPYNTVSWSATIAWTGGAPIVTGPTVVLRSAGLASKLWSVNGAYHFLAGYTSALQPSYFVATVGGKIVGRLAPGNGGGLTARGSLLPEVSQPSTGVFRVAYLLADQVGAQSGVVLSQTGMALATLDFTAAQAAIELSDDLHITGGMLHSFDGGAVVEHNFHLYPENVSTQLTATGGNLALGQYQYVVVFEAWDNYGIHQSSPSVPVTVTTANTTSQVQLTIPTLRLTNRGTPISVVVYRTTANGTVFYRLTPPGTPLLNTTTADTVTYTDTASDASIIGNAQLYTTGGEVENSAAPAPAVICNYGNRLMLVSSENPLEVWFSKQVLQGVPVEFSESFTMTIDQRGGPITAAYQMDDKLILFKERWIFALVGDGPAPNGTPVPAYPPADYVTADSGCKNPKSLVLIPSGLMYQSDKGIYLLGRDLSTTYIGAAVEAYNSANVTSAQQVPNTTQVRFTLDSGACLVYDWLVEQWATFTNIAAADAAIYQGVFTYAQAGGQVLAETPGSFTDSGNPIKLRLTTSWLSFAGLQGFQRVWAALVLGEYRSAHTLRVSLAYDFDPTPQQVVDVSAATLLGVPVYGAGSPYGVDYYGGPFPLYQFRIKALREKCQSVQITLEDNQAAPYGEGLALSAISFLAGVIGPAKKVPSNRTFGA